jgi:glycosyltransferase involved in cell wall biosynthesis
MLARQAAAVIATCTDEVRELTACGARASRMYVVPCGVDRSRFTPAGPAVARGAAPRLLSIGRLVPRKGVDTVIAALRQVPGAELVVAGGPPHEDLDTDPEVTRLRHAAAECQVADRVVFTGRLPHEDVPAMMRSADVVVSDPWYEPFGMVPLEAMACGTPVVVSAVGGHLDTVADHTGRLVPPRDPAALASAIRGLLADRRLRARLGEAGAALAASRYSWHRIAAETEAVYEGLRRPRPVVVVRGMRDARTGAAR